MKLPMLEIRMPEDTAVSEGVLPASITRQHSHVAQATRIGEVTDVGSIKQPKPNLSGAPLFLGLVAFWRSPPLSNLKAQHFGLASRTGQAGQPWQLGLCLKSGPPFWSGSTGSLTYFGPPNQYQGQHSRAIESQNHSQRSRASKKRFPCGRQKQKPCLVQSEVSRGPTADALWCYRQIKRPQRASLSCNPGVLIECDASIKSIIVNINSERNDYIIEDLDDTHLVIIEEKLPDLKERLDEVCFPAMLKAGNGPIADTHCSTSRRPFPTSAMTRTRIAT